MISLLLIYFLVVVEPPQPNDEKHESKTQQNQYAEQDIYQTLPAHEQVKESHVRPIVRDRFADRLQEPTSGHLDKPDTGKTKSP
jgi:hypothetical protein